MEPRFVIDRYRLHTPLGKGATGVVWRGECTSRGERYPIAVKLMTGDLGTDSHEALLREVHAVAAMDHPNIVSVYDYGRVDDDSIDGFLAPDTPYLVMELAAHGTLADGSVPLTTWSGLYWLLTRVLDALAHSHARGVIHRDLKPANVLIADRSTNESGRPRVLLSDFGIAHAHDATGFRVHDGVWQAGSSFAGTPAYMAPEQITGQWRDFGPPTDLYAVGCLCWRLATGSRPFEATSVDDMLRAHIYAEPPAFQPNLPVPVGLEGWLRTLLRKRPAERYCSAAHAMHALSLLNAGPTRRGVTESSGATVSGPSADDDTRNVGPGRDVDDRPRDDTKIDGDPDSTVSLAQTAAPGRRSATPNPRRASDHTAQTTMNASMRLESAHPRSVEVPVPEDWQNLDAYDGRGAIPHGLGLFGVRTVPFCGRVGERTTLWDAFRASTSRSKLRTVVVRGAGGLGKTRLATWLAHRAHELAGARAVRIQCNPPGEGATGIGALLLSLFQCRGLRRAEIHDRVQAWLHDSADAHPMVGTQGTISDARVLTELMVQEMGHTDVDADVRFSAPIERYAAVEHALAVVAARQHIIIHIDDVERSPDLLALVLFLLRPAHILGPVTILLTTRPDRALTHGTSAHLEAITSAEETRLIDLGPLHQSAHDKLVGHLLELDADVIDRVVERTPASPEFAVQLLSDWRERDLFEYDPAQGIRPKDDSALAVPSSTRALWRRRLDTLIDSYGIHDRHDVLLGLELAAAFGEQVSAYHWNSAAVKRGVEVPSDLAERLVLRRLAHWTDRGWTFASDELVTELVSRAREGGRWQQHHVAWVDTLRARGIEARAAEQLAFHLRHAGQLRTAAETLLEAARWYLSGNDVNRVLACIDRRDILLRELDDPASTLARIEGRLLQARTLMRAGDPDYGDAVLEARALVQEHRDALRVPRRWRVELAIIEARGMMSDDPELAQTHLEPALAGAEDLGDPDLISEASLGLGTAALMRGQLDDARTLMTAAYTAAKEAENEQRLAGSLIGRAVICSHQHEHSEATRLARTAMKHFASVGDRRGVVRCVNELGELARRRGDLEAAEAHYRHVTTGQQALGLSPVVATINLALVMCERDAYQDAADTLSSIEQSAASRGALLTIAWRSTRLLTLAALNDIDTFDEQLAALTTELDSLQFRYPDVADVTEKAGDLLADGYPSRARASWEIALGQWRALDRADDARRVAEKLDDLDAGPCLDDA